MFSALFLVGGVAGAVWALPEDWSLPARIGAGLALAMTASLTVFANRFIGGDDFDG